MEIDEEGIMKAKERVVGLPGDIAVGCLPLRVRRATERRRRGVGGVLLRCVPLYFKNSSFLNAPACRKDSR